MPISGFYKALRARIGHDLLLLPGVAAVIHNADGEVLIQERAEGGFSLPAGAIEPGETPGEALVREVWEETGLHVVPTRVLGTFGGKQYRTLYPNGDQAEYTVILFACAIVAGELRCVDGESRSLKFYTVSDIPPLLTEYPRHLFMPGCMETQIA